MSLRHLHSGDEIDLLPLLHSEARARSGRPWVMLNMVASVDGATALQGGATALNDQDDMDLFLALRSVADVVLVGAQTVRAENLGPVRITDEMRRFRSGPDPRLAVATRSCKLGATHRVFSDPDNQPMLVVPSTTSPDVLEELRARADVLTTETDDGVGLVNALSEHDVILCEGGPTLNSQLIEAGLVDEMNLTISPLFGLGPSKRVGFGPELHPPQELRLDRTLIGDRSLFLRYVRESS